MHSHIPTLVTATNTALLNNILSITAAVPLLSVHSIPLP